MLSLYCVNELGILVHSGLLKNENELKSNNFNNKQYKNVQQNEVFAVDSKDLVHGSKKAAKLGLRCILLENCYRII